MHRFVARISLVLFALLALVSGCSEDRKKVTPPTDGDDFNPSSNTTLSGSHTYDSITIPANVTVTAAGDLRLRAHGPIAIAGTIEGDGHAIELRADSSVAISGAIRNDGTGDGDTLGITILGQGDMSFDGAEITSNGDILLQNDSTLTEADFPDTSAGFRTGAGTTPVAQRAAGGDELPTWTIREALFGYDAPARAGRDLPKKGGKGERGKSIDLKVRGNLVVAGGVTIAAQDGGRGGKGTDESTGSAEAEGGRGERGGDVRIFATGQITCAPGVTVRSGRGGDGGPAEATGLPRDGGAVAASAKAIGARAGTSGIIDIRCNESITLNGAFQLDVGSGGIGGPAVAHGADGKPAGTEAAQRGGRAEAIGGAGGDTPEKRLRAANVGGLGNVNLTGGEGGDGGAADAVAGDGGAANAQFTKGGDGGEIVAKGGKGGRSKLRGLAGNLFAKGGDGGDASIDGGNGGAGWSDCVDPCASLAGGDGGRGGDGNIEGGEGGLGSPLGTGGDLTIDLAGNGGNGGDGQPIGVHGGAGGRSALNHGGALFDGGLSFHNGLDGNPCPPVTGACCGAERSCAVYSCLECSNVGGVWQGAGSVCDPNPCPATTGACCYDDGSCTIGSEDDCHGGVFQGVGTLCDPNPCPQPMGACCFPTAPCAVITAELCASNEGAYQGDGIACAPDPCPEGDGACCTGTGSCTVVRRTSCENLGGNFIGSNTDCDPDPCPRFGACCFPSTACILAYEPHCIELEGLFQGESVDCDPDPCSGKPGACCLPPNECVVELETECLGAKGVFMGEGTDCNPNPCVALTGACCSESEGCMLLSQEDCHAGDYQGDGTACDPDPCPTQVGACCSPGVGCELTIQIDCQGTFQGAGTVCSPNPCPESTGACCTFLGFCTQTTQANCSAAWQGASTDCDPNPCPSLASGGFVVVLKPSNDPHHHDPFTLWSTIQAISFQLNGSSISSSGASPYVGSTGTINPNGGFTLNGSGVVAGRSNVDVHFKGEFRQSLEGVALSGSIQLGNDTPPFQLPNGSVTYSISGEHR